MSGRCRFRTLLDVNEAPAAERPVLPGRLLEDQHHVVGGQAGRLAQRVDEIDRDLAFEDRKSVV